MNKKYDSIILGGGIMGLFTAVNLGKMGKNVLIIEKHSIDQQNKKAASFGYSRTYRVDYLDPIYNEFSKEAYDLWLQLEQETQRTLLLKNGCLNLWLEKDGPWEESYAYKSIQTKKSLCREVGAGYFKDNYFVFNKGSFSKNGGLCILENIRVALLNLLKKYGVTIFEFQEVFNICEEKNECRVKLIDGSLYYSDTVVLSVGIGIGEVLSRLYGNKFHPRITLARPMQCRYYYPDSYENLQYAYKIPTFACLDRGIYGHPAFDQKGAIKIGYYKPPGISLVNEEGIEGFMRDYFPFIRTWKSEPVEDVDQCDYLMTGDGDFILGNVPDYKKIFVMTGCNGTGYKFAPLFGKYTHSKLVSRFPRS